MKMYLFYPKLDRAIVFIMAKNEIIAKEKVVEYIAEHKKPYEYLPGNIHQEELLDGFEVCEENEVFWCSD